MQVPKKIIALVTRNRIAFSDKAYEQLYDGPFTLDDLKNSILEGRLVKKEKDETGLARYKYIIIGPALSGKYVYSCGKIIKRFQEEYLILTFHEAF